VIGIKEVLALGDLVEMAIGIGGSTRKSFEET